MNKQVTGNRYQVTGKKIPATRYPLPETSPQERGFVSIFSVLIIMAILTLTVVGFSNITRQAQRRTLDNQLNTQAFYAAETGINDAKAALADNPSYSKVDCTGDVAKFKYDIDVDLKVGYSCVQVNPTPVDIRFSSVGVEGTSVAKTVTMATSTGDAITKFTVNWDSAVNNDPLPSSATADLTPRLTNTSTGVVGWDNKVGILRMDLVPAAGSDWGRDYLVNNSYTFFLYPTSNNAGVNTVTYSPGAANTGTINPVKCNATGLRCKVQITLGGAAVNRYTVRMQALYNDVQVNLNSVATATSTDVTLKDGQAVVDVTGKANDVFRRVQVRLPLKGTGTATNSTSAGSGFAPSFAILSADSLCKRLAVGPVTTVDSAGIPAGADASCKLD